MIYVCPEKDRAVQKPCEPCTCGMNTLAAFTKVNPAPDASPPREPTGPYAIVQPKS